jgi:hypothetical protein
MVVVQSFVRAVGFTTPPTLCPRSREGVLFSWLYVPLVAVCSEVWSAIVGCWLAGGCVWVVLASRVVRVSPAQTGVRDVT